MSDYNREGQGKQNPKGHQPAPEDAGQNPPPNPGQQQSLPDRSDLKSKRPDEPSHEGAHGQEKGLIHQLPGGESG